MRAGRANCPFGRAGPPASLSSAVSQRPTLMSAIPKRTVSSLLCRFGIIGALVSGVVTFGIPAFLTACGPNQLTVWLVYVWGAAQYPAAILLGPSWHSEVGPNLFEPWPQLVAACLVDAILFTAVAACLVSGFGKLFGRTVANGKSS